MAFFLTDGSTPRRTDARWAILQKILFATTGGGGGGGGGGIVQSSGVNFCFTGAAPNQVFKLKNLTTALANRLDTANTDPTVQINIADGDAC